MPNPGGAFSRVNEQGVPVATLYEIMKDKQLEVLPRTLVQQIEAFAQSTGLSVGFCAVLFPYAVAAVVLVVLLIIKKCVGRKRAPSSSINMKQAGTQGKNKATKKANKVD